MGTKGKKKRNSKDSTGSNAGSGEGDGEKKKKEGKKKGGVSKSLGADIFTDSAMENAYYVCHNVQVIKQFQDFQAEDVLKSRGFAWPDGQKKKKKGKR